MKFGGMPVLMERLTRSCLLPKLLSPIILTKYIIQMYCQVNLTISSIVPLTSKVLVNFRIQLKSTQLMYLHRYLQLLLHFKVQTLLSIGLYQFQIMECQLLVTDCTSRILCPASMRSPPFATEATRWSLQTGSV
jgi:hypothetical protein